MTALQQQCRKLINKETNSAVDRDKIYQNKTDNALHQKMNRERYYGCDSNLEESASLQLFLEHQIHSCLRFSPQKMIYV